MESFMTIINRRLSGHEVLNEETIQSIFLGVYDFHKGLSTMYRTRCYRVQTRTASIMLSWGMYGTAYVWNNEGHLISAESFVKQTTPLLMNGAKELLG